MTYVILDSISCNDIRRNFFTPSTSKNKTMNNIKRVSGNLAGERAVKPFIIR